MSLRHVVYALLSAQPTVTGLYGSRVIDAGALGGQEGIVPPLPFLVTKYGEESPSPSARVEDVLLELWSYDRPSDYTRTAQGLRALRSALEGAAGFSHVVGGTRWWLIDVSFQGTSRDLIDDAVRASVKYSTFRIIGNSDQ